MKRTFFSLLQSSFGAFSKRRCFSYGALLFAGGLLAFGLSEAVPSHLRQPAGAVPDAQLARTSEPWMVASFPVENFQAYTSPYGYRGSGFHYGIDIAAPTGSYIRNWWEGRVIEVSDDSACGTSVVIQSGDWTHVYCHMQGYVTTV